jgi:hypothetical protein
VVAEPGNAEDDGVIADTADIEGAGFLVGADTEGSSNGMGDRTGGYRAAIDDMEWAGDGFLDKVKFVLGDESVISGSRMAESRRGEGGVGGGGEGGRSGGLKPRRPPRLEPEHFPIH